MTTSAQTARETAFQALNMVPCWTITFTHDMGSNMALLGEIRP